jgi:predicted transcriptional regulator
MTPDVATVTPDTTLEEIATLMRDEDTGAIPVVEDNELIGIVTDRDIVLRCVAQGRDASETMAEDVMSSDIASIHPDTDLQEASQLMSAKQIRRLPVTEDGMLVGMLSLGDISVKQRERPKDKAGEALQHISQGVKTSHNLGERRRTSGENREQGIATHSVAEENARQSRVIPFREQGERTPRRNPNKGKTSNRKTS